MKDNTDKETTFDCTVTLGPSSEDKGERELTDKPRTSREISNANLKPQIAGQPSINPKGRPKKEHVISDCIREELSKIDKDSGLTNAQMIAKAMVARSKKLDSRGDATILGTTLDRDEGKVKDVLEVEGGSVEITFIPAKEKDG